MDLYEGLPVRLDADTAVSWTINMTAGFDTYLHFYSKNPETGSLSLLASDDDGGNGLNSRISFNPEVGVEYVIGASAYSSGSSSYSLFLRQTVDGTAGPNYSLHDGEEIPPVGGAGDDILVSGATIQTYTLDTVANTITASLDEDQGLSDDAIINDPANTGINVTGAETNSTVEYALNDGAYAASYDDIKGSITNGDTVNVRHTDLAGNESFTSVTVTVDTTAPVMSPVTDAASTITTGTVTYQLMFPEPVLPGSININDFAFDTTNGTLTPTAVSAAGVGTLVDGGYSTVAVTMTVSGEGLLEAALASTATVLDVAGNNFVFLNGSSSSPGNMFEADVDDVHPTVTAITRAPDLDPSSPSDTGSSATDGVTDASSLTFRVDFSEPVDGTSLTYDTGEGVFPRFDIIALQSSDNTDVASSFFLQHVCLGHQPRRFRDH